MTRELLAAGATSMGWVAPANMTYEEWAAVGATMQTINRMSAIWLGDWLCEGERRYGETYAEAILFTDKSIEQLTQYKWVMGSVPREVRQPGLSFTHYRLVAKLPLERQRDLLQWCATYGIPTDVLARAVREESEVITTRPKRITKDSDPQSAAAWLHESFNREWIAELRILL